VAGGGVVVLGVVGEAAAPPPPLLQAAAAKAMTGSAAVLASTVTDRLRFMANSFVWVVVRVSTERLHLESREPRSCSSRGWIGRGLTA
jgi:hypothetical protein